MNTKMVDETPKDKLHLSGVMLCTYRFFDPELPENTRLIVKARSDVKALKYAEEEIGDIVYDSYYFFNLLMGSLIIIITYPFRLMGSKLLGVEVNICSWLDKYFPLPD